MFKFFNPDTMIAVHNNYYYSRERRSTFVVQKMDPKAIETIALLHITNPEVKEQPGVTLLFGSTKVSLKDEYDRNVGRELATERMVPTRFMVNSVYSTPTEVRLILRMENDSDINLEVTLVRDKRRVFVDTGNFILGTK
jgi:hypothetical protein